MVRDVSVIELGEGTDNLVLGSSIVRKLEEDALIPNDIGIHAYSGSTAKEKIQTVNKYPEHKLKTLVIQDGTNNILKHKKSAASMLN